jgi:S1-C subfamily serine protease
MFQEQALDLVTPPNGAAEPPTPVVIRVDRLQRSRRTGTLVTLSALLLVVFGVGLFAGWVYGTRSTASIPSGLTSHPQATSVGNALDAMREATIAKVRPTVVQINVTTSSGNGLGSGVLLDSRGYIVTNNHVIADAQHIQVILYDGTPLPAQLVGTDPLDDLAVVKITTTLKLTAATPGDSSRLQVGQEVLTIGNPLGIPQTVTSGIISGLDRPVSTLPDAIQTDAAINPGNSGGALVDLQGKIIGIPTLTIVDPQTQVPVNGVGFAIPSNRVQLIVPQIIATGRVAHTGRAMLAIQAVTVDAALVTQKHLPVASGVLITKSATSGLQADDVLTQIGTYVLVNGSSLAKALASMKPGDRVSVTVYRGNRQLTVSVTLDEASAQ